MEWSAITSQRSFAQAAALVLATIVTVDIVRRFIRNRIENRTYSLPPGPTPLPLLGSALSVNASEPWLTYTVWRAKYGDLVYVRLLDNDVVVLNSYSDAIELLEKRSQIYSDRPFIATVEPYGHHTNMGFASYGPHWRLCRRIFHETFRAEAALNFRPMQLARARRMALNIIDDPVNYRSHYSTFASSVAMSSIYDYETEPRGDPMVKLAEDFLKVSVPALTPEKAVLLKAFPFLMSVPLWIPVLSRMRREARYSHALGAKLIEIPYQWVQKRMVAKEHVLSHTMVFDHLQRMETLDESHRADYEKALKHASSTAFVGSSDSVAGTMMIFTLAMVKNPHVWERAQAEIDAVTGTDRLPEFDDRSCLPYVEAVVRETVRWQPVSPLGVPHALTSNDVYKGYHIPSGATVIANIWAMSRDETRYADPEAFKPERFLDSGGKLIDDDPFNFVFGFGRRRCPGVYAADASVWSGIATMLATLDFDAFRDKNENVVEFEAKFSTGIARAPVPFPCNLAPRGHITRESIQRFLSK